MSRKRPAVPPEEPLPPQDEAEEVVENPVSNRRNEMAKLARRRAAHFATFDGARAGAGGGDGGEGGREGRRNTARNVAEENPHVGGDTARSLGPWSSAMQLANAREKELERREDKIMEGNRGGSGSKKGTASMWTPSRDVALGHRKQCSVQPLSQITMRLVVNLIQQIETLWGLPDMVKTRIAAEVCAQRALTAETVGLFTEHSPTEVCLPDCSNLEAEALGAAVLEAATLKLERLELGLCGRGLTNEVAQQLANGGALATVKQLRLSGAYRLTDAGLSSLLRCLPALESLAIPQCPRIEGPAVELLPQTNPLLKSLNLAECRGISGDTLLQAIKGLPLLEELKLDGILEVDDTFLKALGTTVPKLTSLSLSTCSNVSDAGIEALVTAGCSGLLRVWLDECDIGLQAVKALACKCRNLQALFLSRCLEIDDSAVDALATLPTLRRVCLNGAVDVTNRGVVALARGVCSSSLEELDVSWCRAVDALSLGLLVDSCPGLRRLVVWGCSQVDDTFLLGHSNDELVVVGRGEKVVPVVL